MKWSAAALLGLLMSLSPIAAQTRVYVQYSCEQCSSGMVAVLDAATNKITATIPIKPTVGQGFRVG